MVSLVLYRFLETVSIVLTTEEFWTWILHAKTTSPPKVLVITRWLLKVSHSAVHCYYSQQSPRTNCGLDLAGQVYPAKIKLAVFLFTAKAEGNGPKGSKLSYRSDIPVFSNGQGHTKVYTNTRTTPPCCCTHSSNRWLVFIFRTNSPVHLCKNFRHAINNMYTKKAATCRNSLTCKVFVSHIFKVLSNELDVNMPVS